MKRITDKILDQIVEEELKSNFPNKIVDDLNDEELLFLKKEIVKTLEFKKYIDKDDTKIDTKI